MNAFLTGFLFCFGGAVGLYAAYQFVILTNKLIVISRARKLESKVAKLLWDNKELKFFVGELEYFKRNQQRGSGHKIERLERKIDNLVTDLQVKDELLLNPVRHGIK